MLLVSSASLSIMFGFLLLCSILLKLQAQNTEFFTIAKDAPETEVLFDTLWTTEDEPWSTTISEEVDDLYIKETNSLHHEPNGKPVFASQFIRDCDYNRAKNMLQVKPIMGVQSYSGYITVNRRYNSNLFFWLVSSQQNPTLDPVVVWLMGFPGFSSMYGAFQENGPFRFSPSGNLTLNEYSWTKRYNMLYIDNPVGIGYSFTDNVAGFSKSQEQVAENLYKFMVQFYELFPELRKNQLIIGGESLGGKFATSLAYEIHKHNPASHTKMNMTGLFVGNSFLDPVNMLDYSSYLYRLGIIDYQSLLEMQKLEKNIKRFIYMKEWIQALKLSEQVHAKLVEAGYEDRYDVTQLKINLLDKHVAEYLNRPETKQLFHVGDTPFYNHEQVYQYLREDMFQSVKLKVEGLLSHLKVVFYSGQFDMLVTRANTHSFTTKLRWTDAIKFAKQQPITWRIDNEVVGFVSSVSNLTEVLIRNAHHMTAASQPEYVFRLFNLFVDVGKFTDITLLMADDDYL